MAKSITDHKNILMRNNDYDFLREPIADRLTQICNMVEAANLASTQDCFNLPVVRDLYRALLPESAPNIPGWEFEVFYRPADLLSADFYDFISLPDGRIGISLGDVAGKGPYAALQMAKTSNFLHQVAVELLHPGEVLERLNDILCREHQPSAFVTCFYVVLDPASGKIEYANAGHTLPYILSAEIPVQVDELYATGMPLGIFPGRSYEQQVAWLSPGESLLLLSDGILEARDNQGTVFGTDGMRWVLQEYKPDQSFIPFFKDQIEVFTGSNRVHQDDMSLIKLYRMKDVQLDFFEGIEASDEVADLLIAEFSLPSISGNERLAVERIVEIVQRLGLSPSKFENLKTALAETVMNAIHHGNRDKPEIPVEISVRQRGHKLMVEVVDSGNDPFPVIPVPDLQAKISGKQTAHGWGLFLVQELVDEIYVSLEENHHRVQLVFYPDGEKDG